MYKPQTIRIYLHRRSKVRSLIRRRETQDSVKITERTEKEAEVGPVVVVATPILKAPTTMGVTKEEEDMTVTVTVTEAVMVTTATVEPTPTPPPPQDED